MRIINYYQDYQVGEKTPSGNLVTAVKISTEPVETIDGIHYFAYDYTFA